MAFCTKCGYKLAEGAKFCFECGTKVDVADMTNETTNSAFEGEQASAYVERKQEYAGKIIKCPACGAELPSFAAICPDCGHEINSQNVSPYIREFSKCIDEYDHAIANDPEPPKTGWKTWSKNKRILWVILNICTVFIPWVIYLAYPLIKPFVFPKSVPVLSTNEKQKAALIENATFPNEREATIEAMMFTKSKMAFLATEKFNKKTQYWTNLWNTKADQLNQRANIILKGDKIVESTYSAILTCKRKIYRHVRVRAVIGTTIILTYMIIVLVGGTFLHSNSDISMGASVIDLSSFWDKIGEMFSGIQMPHFDGTDNFEWLDTGLSLQIPKIDSSRGRYRTNSNEELDVLVEGISYAQFERYVDECAKMGYVIDQEKDTSSYTAYNNEGYFLDLQYMAGSLGTGSLNIVLRIPIANNLINWPTTGPATLLPIIPNCTGEIETNLDHVFRGYITGITHEEYNTYVDNCIAAGLEKKYRYEDSFVGGKGEEIHLTIKYIGFNTIEIYVYIRD